MSEFIADQALKLLDNFLLDYRDEFTFVQKRKQRDPGAQFNRTIFYKRLREKLYMAFQDERSALSSLSSNGKKTAHDFLNVFIQAVQLPQSQENEQFEVVDYVEPHQFAYDKQHGNLYLLGHQFAYDEQHGDLYLLGAFSNFLYCEKVAKKHATPEELLDELLEEHIQKLQIVLRQYLLPIFLIAVTLNIAYAISPSLFLALLTSIQLVNLVKSCVNYLEHFYHDEEKQQAVSFFISTLAGALIMAFAANYFVPFVGAFNLLIAGTHLYHHNKSQATASLQSGLISTYGSYLIVEKLAPFLLTLGVSSPVAICCVSLILAIRGAFVVASAVTQNQDRSLKAEAQNSATMLSADPYHFRLNQEKDTASLFAMATVLKKRDSKCIPSFFGRTAEDRKDVKELRDIRKGIKENFEIDLELGFDKKVHFSLKFFKSASRITQKETNIATTECSLNRIPYP